MRAHCPEDDEEKGTLLLIFRELLAIYVQRWPLHVFCLIAILFLFFAFMRSSSSKGKKNYMTTCYGCLLIGCRTSKLVSRYQGEYLLEENQTGGNARAIDYAHNKAKLLYDCMIYWSCDDISFH